MRKMQIMECSMDLFITRGYAATGIRDIATRLSISTGLFFNYFESKEALYLELVRVGVNTPRELFLQCLAAPSPIHVLTEIAKVILGALRESSFTAKMFLLMTQAISFESAPDSVKQLVSGFDMVTPIIEVIEKGQAAGQIREGNPYAIAVAFWGAVQGIAEYAALTPSLPLPEPEWIVQMLKPAKDVYSTNFKTNPF